MKVVGDCEWKGIERTICKSESERNKNSNNRIESERNNNIIGKVKEYENVKINAKRRGLEKEGEEEKDLENKLKKRKL